MPNCIRPVGGANLVAVPSVASCADVVAVGLLCDAEGVCDNNVVIDGIVSQDPSPGTMVSPGTFVKVIISLGPCTDVVVPVATSCADIEALGLICNINDGDCSDTVPEGEVAFQEPAAGSVVPAGSVVTLFVSSGGCGAVVPVTNSCADLEARGLVCQIENICSDTVAVGGVIGTDPVAGTEVDNGATVILNVSNGPGVPLGSFASCAEVEAAGYICQTFNGCSDTEPIGAILNQFPTSDASSEDVTTVLFEINSGPCLNNTIDICYEDGEGPFDPECVEIIERAVSKWNQILPAGTTPTPFNGDPAYTKIEICFATRLFVDGDLALGKGNPVITRPESLFSTPLQSRVDINANFVDQMCADGTLYTVVLHEIAHALGMRSGFNLWEAFTVSDGMGGFCYSGANATAQYNALAGNPNPTATCVPLIGDHWSDLLTDGLTNELLTPGLSGLAVLFPNISPVTIGVFEDMGFVVDYTVCPDFVWGNP